MNKLELPETYKNTTVYGVECVLYDTHVEVKEPSGINKSISHNDFSNILNKTIESPTQMKKYLLPANCYSMAVGRDSVEFGCYYPGRLRTIAYQHRGSTALKKYNIPFPNIIITFSLRKDLENWRMSSARYFATSKTIGQLDCELIAMRNHQEQIWCLPLGNSYGDGRLCEGRNSMPRVFTNNFRGLNWYFAVLYTSPFNDDLGVLELKTPVRLEEWYKELEKHKEFPYELLHGGIKVSTSLNIARGIGDNEIILDQSPDMPDEEEFDEFEDDNDDEDNDDYENEDGEQEVR